jgi:hypothetical protein
MPKVWGLHMPHEIGFAAVEAARMSIGSRMRSNQGMVSSRANSFKTESV